MNFASIIANALAKAGHAAEILGTMKLKHLRCPRRMHPRMEIASGEVTKIASESVTNMIKEAQNLETLKSCIYFDVF